MGSEEQLTPKESYSLHIDEARADYNYERRQSLAYLGGTSLAAAVGVLIGQPEFGVGAATVAVPVSAYHGFRAIKMGNFIATAEALKLHDEYVALEQAQQDEANS